MEYSPQQIEKKWQRRWQEKGLFEAKDKAPGKKISCLDMFPYPSAEGLHVGHLRGYTFTDVISKKKIMEGFNVLHPMGWDAFGLPAENYALKTGIHPAKLTKKSIRNFKKQLTDAGFGYDWSREIYSCDPEYYQWTQWLFLKLYEQGLVYRKKAPVNWCPSCKTVLANEQVVEGKCERCSSLVKNRYLKQWFFKITQYASRLLKDLDKLDWPPEIKTMQRNWIGRSEGSEIQFGVSNSDYQINVFTTRPDTLFGCTYLVISPQHEIIEDLKSKIKNLKEIKGYLKKSGFQIERERISKEKTGVKISGLRAINPANQEKIPIFVGDYVLKEYGTGAIMAVPAHDQRDFEFARKHNLPIIRVIKPSRGNNRKIKNDKAYEGEGILINSQKFSGMDSSKAKEEITEFVGGQKKVYYQLRDWLISRQRYWGTPIPVIYCDKCGVVPVPSQDLPVKLPMIEDFKPSEAKKSPLANNEDFLKVKCPKCGGPAERETDTMDTFVDSSWYYLRYTDPSNQKEFASKEKINQWLPVDLYVGGAEHAVMHLLYARFIAKFLHGQELIDFDEPFVKLFNQGLIYYQGAKMSKSRGNVINPNQFIEKYGADTMRVYQLFMGPSDQATEWSDQGVIGVWRFLNKVWGLKTKVKNEKIKDPQLDKLVHQTIKKVGEDIEEFRFNTAVSALMILVNEMNKCSSISLSNFKVLLKLLAPMAPHVCEELWCQVADDSEKISSIFSEEWPPYNPQLIKPEQITLVIQVNGKIRDKVKVDPQISKGEAQKLALSRPKVKKRIQSKKVKKIVFVPQKLINIVT